MKNRVVMDAISMLALEREIKSTERSRICVVRDRKSGVRYIYRSFLGNGEVYRKLQGKECPYLPKIFDVSEAEGWVYVLEEFIQGDTLAFLLEGKPLSSEHAAQILTHVCKALEILHGLGAVHRDIKPENIILRGSEAVLIDFDASRICKPENHMDTQIMGTTGYAAPEQYGFSQTDARADIYALGILLNEMLTCQHPSRLLAEGEYRSVIQKCTQINADQRYMSVRDLMDALNKPTIAPVAKGIHVWWLAIPAVILVVVLLFLQFAGQTEEDKLQFPSAPENALLQVSESSAPPETPPTTLPDIHVFYREQLEIPKRPWEGSTQGYATPFKCDMDGDGIQEDYLFGMKMINCPNQGVVYYDINTAFHGDEYPREVHPCVWRVAEDGDMTIAWEFAALLTNAKVNIWRVDDLGAPMPEAWTMDHTWPGCVSVIFYPKTNGTWLYEVTADLGQEHLTAIATTSFYFE